MRLLCLFQNLIGNAVKYQKPGQTPHIHIRAADCNDHWEFSVADNGIGIPNDYAEVIFTPFKRLHSEQEYAGTGIGLSIYRRIVENLGGTIWVESTPDQGSVFFFTIPKQISLLQTE